MRRTPRALLPALLALVLALLLSACGSEDGSADSDPEELLKQTFSSEGEISSGSLDTDLEIAISGDNGGSIKATLTGPFESRGEKEFPLVDLDLDLEVDGSTGFAGGVTVTEDGAFVDLDGQAYAVDEETFATLDGLYSQSVETQQQEGQDGAAVFDQLGISPEDWLTDVSNEGTEEIGGAETVHISGNADIARIVEDVEAVGVQAGGAAGLDPGLTAELADSVETASVDVYTGTEDALLRRLELALELKEPGGSETIALAVAVEIDGVNEAQEFVAPEDPKPLADLLGGLGGLEGLGGLGGLEGLGGLGGLGGGAAPAPGSGGGGGLPGVSPEYLDCLAEAATPEEIADCAPLL